VGSDSQRDTQETQQSSSPRQEGQPPVSEYDEETYDIDNRSEIQNNEQPKQQLRSKQQITLFPIGKTAYIENPILYFDEDGYTYPYTSDSSRQVSNEVCFNL
jgi:hypothetical protein